MVGSTTGTRLTVARLVYGVVYSFTVTATSTGGASAASATTVVRTWIDVLRLGQSLTGSEQLWSANRAYYLEIANGHLVVRSRAGRNRWVAPASPGTEVSLTATGNLEFTNGPKVLWASRTNVAGGILRVSKTGVLQLWRGDHLVWQSHGVVRAPGTPVVTVPAA